MDNTRWPDPRWDPLITAAYHRLPIEITNRLQELYDEREAAPAPGRTRNRQLPGIDMIEDAINTCMVVMAQAARRKAPMQAATPSMDTQSLTANFHREHAKIQALSLALHNQFAAEVLYNTNPSESTKLQLENANRDYATAKAGF